MAADAAAARRKFLRENVVLHSNRVSNTASTDVPGTNAEDGDEVLDIEAFKEKFRLDVIKMEKKENEPEERLEFDLIGIDAALANAFRRVLIAEVPTMAIERVFVMNNTSLIQDEILSHRIGLIPIKADARLFQFRQPEEDPTDINTIVFRLKIKCTKNRNAPPDATDEKIKYINSCVYSGDLQWLPQGTQERRFKHHPIKPVHDDILIARLRPGQEIDLQMYCEKGIGKTHAKWSPVATASYRLLPQIKILKEISGDEADKFAKCFSPGVIKVVTKNGKRIAKVNNPRNDTVSREVLRHPEFADKVELSRRRDHFIFSIESVGIIPPHVLLHEALTILIQKCQTVKVALAQIVNPDAEQPQQDEPQQEEEEEEEEE